MTEGKKGQPEKEPVRPQTEGKKGQAEETTRPQSASRQPAPAEGVWGDEQSVTFTVVWRGVGAQGPASLRHLRVDLEFGEGAEPQATLEKQKAAVTKQRFEVGRLEFTQPMEEPGASDM